MIQYSNYWIKKDRKYLKVSKKTLMTTISKGIHPPLPGKFRVFQVIFTKKVTLSSLKMPNGSFQLAISAWMKRPSQSKLKWLITPLKSKSLRTTSKRKNFSFPQMWLGGCRTKLTSLNKPLMMKIFHRKKSKRGKSRWS